MTRAITVGVDAGDVRGNDNRAIQIAVDALGAAGGIVRVLPGVYTCHDAVHLKSGVTLQGSGPDTILKNCPGVWSCLAVDADYGQYKVTPVNPEGFAQGMRVHVRDDKTGGWLESIATITGVRDGVLHLDRHLMMDYSMAANVTVSNAGALVSAIDQNDIAVEALTLDGQRASQIGRAHV